MDGLSPLAAYRHAVDDLGFAPDAAQLHAATLLEQCQQALHEGAGAIGGVYLWGPVGRGKTWLLDRFYQGLRVPARRLHFHHFMRWVHRRLFALTGTADPLRALARELALEVRVLCFDELFVSDIGDAILLGGLLQVMFEEGVVLVATSNQPPTQLYADGFNRQRFIPAIEAIARHMQVVAVDGGQDHRLHPGAAQPRYWVIEPGRPSVLAAVFAELDDGAASHDRPLHLGHRDIPVHRQGPVALWCDYAALCEAPLAALDFIALCDRFGAILLGAVPRLGAARREGRIARGTEDGAERVAAGDRQLPQLSPLDDGVRRFIALVDECYDRRVPLYIEAEVPLEQLYTEGWLEFPFRRTLSRLREMQLARFGRA
ncbi:cell division protein ZapE [Pseudomonas sp. USHLN015]|uniref:cell division protein ZapE n=1 Tax=Pseudomonas sp. USHLN015 TaxID=3081296 RepID=UPI00301BE964